MNASRAVRPPGHIDLERGSVEDRFRPFGLYMGNDLSESSCRQKSASGGDRRDSGLGRNNDGCRVNFSRPFPIISAQVRTARVSGDFCFCRQLEWRVQQDD